MCRYISRSFHCTVFMYYNFKGNFKASTFSHEYIVILEVYFFYAPSLLTWCVLMTPLPPPHKSYKPPLKLFSLLEDLLKWDQPLPIILFNWSLIICWLKKWGWKVIYLRNFYLFICTERTWRSRFHNFSPLSWVNFYHCIFINCYLLQKW